MSDSKKPMLSEIRAEAYLSPIHVPYLLDLVEKMGKELGDQQCSGCEQYFGNPGEPCTGCKEARVLLEEIKL